MRTKAQADRGCDAGYVSLYLVVVTIGLLVLAGLVLDGGRAIAARERAFDVSQQAARAGANALSQQSLRNAVPLSLDSTAAMAAAEKVLTTGDVAGDVSIDATTVTVRVTVYEPTVVLSIVGINELTANASASAEPIRGTTAEEEK